MYTPDEYVDASCEVYVPLAAERSKKSLSLLYGVMLITLDLRLVPSIRSGIGQYGMPCHHHPPHSGDGIEAELRGAFQQRGIFSFRPAAKRAREKWLPGDSYVVPFWL